MTCSFVYFRFAADINLLACEICISCTARAAKRAVAAAGWVVKVFEGIDGGRGGPEGNYRQRLYRLKTAAPGASRGADAEPSEMAA